MWQSTKPTDQDIQKATVVARRMVSKTGSPVTIAECFRIQGPAFSRVQYDVCILEGSVIEPMLLPGLVTAMPIQVVNGG